MKKNMAEKMTETNNIYKLIDTVINKVAQIDNIDSLIDVINYLRIEIHKISPFKNEPVDCVQWIKSNDVKANDYNPNIVAPPEMNLLELSIRNDGYTQPIVCWQNNGYVEVVDGFHRNRVGKEILDIKSRIKGYLPVTVINSGKEKRNERIAATIRHNRARGKHTVDGMSDIVIELKKRNWTDQKIANELGMEQDEILRLCQISGLAELFSDREFSKSWDVEDSADDFVELEDNIAQYDDEDVKGFRTVNTDDEDRIFHQWNKWECYKAGFYSKSKNDMSRNECEKAYADFLSDRKRFDSALKSVIEKWKNSCEHYLTNKSMNRIAWLGQAAMCYATGIPSVYRNGFNLLNKKQQQEANEIALKWLNIWLKRNERDNVEMDAAMGKERQMDLY